MRPPGHRPLPLATTLALLFPPFALLVGVALAVDPEGANYDEAKVPPYRLPDLLTLADGTPVRDATPWTTRRRPELLELFAREVYGRTPGGAPAGMHWEVTSVNRTALGGRAVRREITLWFAPGRSGPALRLLIYQPPGEPGAHAPWPAFLGLNFSGNQSVHADPGISLASAWLPGGSHSKAVDHRATDAMRGTESAQWSVEQVVERGYATVTAYYGDLCEDRPEGLTRDVGALFGTGTADGRRPGEWGAIGIWAWGLSRALDYLQADPEIDGHRVAVHGHSRLGKAALWAAAQDERFALIISNESGCGGAALSKRIFGETVRDINGMFPHWFARSFRAYNDREADLPVDQHELLALIAPRPLYVASAAEDRWADPRGEFLALQAASPAYALFGRRGLAGAEWPPPDQPLRGDGVAYHVRSGPHDITPYDWARYLDFADRQLRGGTAR